MANNITNDDPRPPLGDPGMRVFPPAPTGSIEAPDSLAARAHYQGPLGHPDGVPPEAFVISDKTRDERDAEEKRKRLAKESAAAGQIIRVIPDLRLPRFLASSGFLLGVGAILGLVGLFVFAQTVALIAQIEVFPLVPRRICYALLTLLLGAIVLAVGRLFISYFGLRRTQRITLRGIDDLNERAQFRELAGRETKDARRRVRKYLDDFPPDKRSLVAMGFSLEQADKLIEHLRDLTDPVKKTGDADWLKRFRKGYQSVVDEAAEECIKKYAWRVAVKTAAVPLALVDTAIVLHGAFAMIGDLCRIYRLRLGASSTLVVMGWAAVQGVVAGKIEESAKDADSWSKTFHDHFSHSAHTDDAPQDAVAAAGNVAGDLHVPGVGRILKRAAKGFVQYIFLRRLGRLTQSWLRMVE